MDLSAFFKSIVDQDTSAIVICGLDHNILYLNPSARERYKKRGELVGKSILDCHNEHSREMILRVVEWFSESISHNIIFTYHNEPENKDVYMVALRDENGELIGYYEKHEYRSPESKKPYDFGLTEPNH